jgi:hypothetical protein
MTRTRIFANAALSLSLAAGMLTAAHTASAQTPTRLKATIPFGFTADDKTLPAGTYFVEISHDRIVSLSDVKSGKQVNIIVHPNYWTPTAGHTRLSFRREAGSIYLSQIWVEGKQIHSDVAHRAAPVQEMAQLALPDASFEIAMR